FAGCSVETVGGQTRLRVAPAARARRHSRLDIDYLLRLTSSLIADRALRSELVLRPSSSLYRAGGRLRYTRCHVVDGARSYQLMGVDDDPTLQAILERAANGACLQELAASLVADADASLEEATEYLHALVDAELLVPDLTPTVTGPEPMHHLIDTLNPIRPELAASLKKAGRQLEEIDAQPIGDGDYRQVAETLRALPAAIGTRNLFQVDLVKPGWDATLGPEIVREIADAVALLHALEPKPLDQLLRQFRDKFFDRYERAEVPLVEALDEESGVGFGDPALLRAEATSVLKGIAFDAAPPREPQATWGARESFLLRKLEHAARSGADELVFTPAELKPFMSDSPAPMPDAFSAQATVEAESEAAIADGRFRVRLGSVWGPSGARMFGRFCHGDPQLTEQVVAHLRAEEQLRDDAIFVEIVHLPPARLGNVLLRPVLREWELPFLGRSGAPQDRQLPITDLLVSVRDGRIVLRSARLGREIIPRLTTAHNYEAPRNLNLYRFLCSLQDQGVVSRVGWSWGPLGNASFLPRVVVGRTVVARASWNLGEEELRPLAAETTVERFRAVQSLRASARLPRFVAIEENDHVLPFDLDNVLSVETLVHLVRKRPALRHIETTTPDRLCASGADGRFMHEVVVPFVRSAPAARPPAPTRSRPPAEAVTRAFPPGSDWLYAMIYCGSNTADE
ncbi:MAG TPA: lantibiotic dehydratase family protein, partial [Polyangia bacterium]